MQEYFCFFLDLIHFVPLTNKLTISIDFQRPTIQSCWCARQRVSNPGRGHARKVQKTSTACILLDFIERLRAICG